MGTRALSVKCLIQVEIACPGFVDPRRSDGALGFSGPAFQAAVEEGNRKYAGLLNFSLTFLSEEDYYYSRNRGNITASALANVRDSGVEMVAEWYYTKRQFPISGMSVIIGTAGGDFTHLHELAANWNILYLQTVAYTRSDYQLPASPVIATIPFSVLGISQTFINLLELYRWTTVYLVLDLDSPYIFNLFATQLEDSLRAAPSTFTVIKRDITSRSLERSSQGYNSILGDFTTLSRVMIFFGRADHLRRMLIDAWHRNMTNGEYVYVAWGTDDASKQPRVGNSTWSYGDHFDEVARRAFGSLLVVQQVEPIYTVQYKADLEDFLAELRRRARVLFDTSYTASEQPSQEVLSSYASIGMLAQVLNESLASNGEASLRDALTLGGMFLNRTFHNRFAELHIDRTGIRRRPQSVVHTKRVSEQIEAFLLESADEPPILKTIRDISIDWPSGAWPPLNEPLCGYKNDRRICQNSGWSQSGVTGCVMDI
ncbi:hypothetical protein BV898_08688 [Hypsibius exemplaris]|uniref:Receptor ligand binding region domain-containing protein n=1 Tax=Hypsibius exemplaris TaxID=2072580 RepID=A0A1W0WQ03_HYPEX|nr:hypothetical protein BV898_08688 [Hypsibius exemplaris]